MTEAKFTPAPWVMAEAFGLEFKTEGVEITAPSRKRCVGICVVENMELYEEDETLNRIPREQIANAHLIAAAPDMYPVCAELEIRADDIDASYPNWDDDMKARQFPDYPLAVKGRYAAKKARGEA